VELRLCRSGNYDRIWLIHLELANPVPRSPAHERYPSSAKISSGIHNFGACILHPQPILYYVTCTDRYRSCNAGVKIQTPRLWIPENLALDEVSLVQKRIRKEHQNTQHNKRKMLLKLDANKRICYSSIIWP